MIIKGNPNVKPIREAYAPLTELQVFDVYQTRQDYEEATGNPCPPPDPKRRRKHWFDPAYAGVSQEDDDGQLVFYQALAVNPRTRAVVRDFNGKPMLTTIALSKWEAGQVNIPEGTANEFPLSEPIMMFDQIQTPLRSLTPEEELEFYGPMGVVRVVNTVLRDADKAKSEQFTAADREALRQILQIVREIERRV
jgi:hypothetical protein